MKRSKRKVTNGGHGGISTTKVLTILVLLAVWLLPVQIYCQILESNEIDQTSNDIINPDEYNPNDQFHYVTQPPDDGGGSAGNQYTEINVDGNVITGEKVLNQRGSPYLLRSDLVVDRDGKLSIEAGTTVYFAPMVGVIVKGVLKAVVSRSFY